LRIPEYVFGGGATYLVAAANVISILRADVDHDLASCNVNQLELAAGLGSPVLFVRFSYHGRNWRCDIKGGFRHARFSTSCLSSAEVRTRGAPANFRLPRPNQSEYKKKTMAPIIRCHKQDIGPNERDVETCGIALAEVRKFRVSG
jgi:hypothetical protein